VPQRLLHSTIRMTLPGDRRRSPLLPFLSSRVDLAAVISMELVVLATAHSDQSNEQRHAGAQDGVHRTGTHLAYKWQQLCTSPKCAPDSDAATRL
jgi:hypothetical protein